MSLLSLIHVLIGLAVGVVLALTFVFVKKQRSQAAVAGDRSQIKQAGRDLVEVGKYTHSQTQLVQGQVAFLAQGEELAISPNLADFEEKVSKLWTGAVRYVYAVSLYGRPFMPPTSQVEDILRRGVEIRMVLVDPSSPAAKEIAENKCRFSRSIEHYEVLAQTLNITQLSAVDVFSQVEKQVKATLELWRAIKRRHPDYAFKVAFINFLPTWKGTIVDGKSAVYLIYDVPRMDVPFRFTTDGSIIRFYERHYFTPYWAASKEVSLET